MFVIANGEKVKALNTDGTERLVSGTSFSAAYIAGLAAKVQAESTEKFREYLKSNAIDKGTVGFDNSYGFGLIEKDNLLKEDLK